MLHNLLLCISLPVNTPYFTPSFDLVRQDFAARLLLPNKFTGYVYLLDRSNRVRWHGCGHAEDADLENLRRLVDQLIAEQTITIAATATKK